MTPSHRGRGHHAVARRLLALVLALALALTLLATPLCPAPALACGGFFSPVALPPEAKRVVQEGQRILLLRDPATKTTTIWIEVRYSGDAKDFAWVLPVPAKPEVGVGSAYVFDRLDQATAPRFVAHWDIGWEGCRVANPAASMGCGGYPDTYGGSGSAQGGDGSPQAANRHPKGLVKVVAEAQVGPFDYQVLDSGSASDLQGWLNTRGFAVPDSAKPVLAEHLAKGDLFVAVKLRRGAAVDDIRPLALELHDVPPQLPLRLSAIAAREDMAVTVYLTGEGRAVPKNHLHVTLNPMRLAWGHAEGVNNYDEVMSSAIDEAGGRGFVTEYARPVSATEVQPEDIGPGAGATFLYREPVLPTKKHAKQPGAYGPAKGMDAMFAERFFDTSRFATVTTFGELLQALWQSDLALTRDVAAILEAHTGAVAAATWEEGTLDFWRRAQRHTANAPLPRSATVDGAALASDLEARFATPMRKLAARLRAAQTLTRLSMRISPDEIDRNALFGFNPGLPDVSPLTEVTMSWGCSTGARFPDLARISAEGGGSWVISTPITGTPGWSSLIDPRFAQAPAAMRIEVLDETGAARAVHREQLALVDEALRGAAPGAPSLSPDLALRAAGVRWTPPPSDGPIDLANAADDVSAPAGACSPGAPFSSPVPTLLGMAAALLLWRRRSGSTRS